MLLILITKLRRLPVPRGKSRKLPQPWLNYNRVIRGMLFPRGHRWICFRALVLLLRLRVSSRVRDHRTCHSHIIQVMLDQIIPLIVIRQHHRTRLNTNTTKNIIIKPSRPRNHHNHQ